MPFNMLLMFSLVSKTGFSENSKTTSITPKSGEISLFFDLTKSNISAIVREGWNLPKEGEKLCDGIILHLKPGDNQPGKKKTNTICLVELKGKDTEHALEQIENTYKTMKNKLEQSPSVKKLLGNQCEIVWKGYIEQSRSAPDDSRMARKKRAELKKSLMIATSHETNLDEFLHK